MRAVEPFIAVLRLALRQAVDEIAPRALARVQARLRARDRLDVRGDPFLDPMMLARDGGEGEVNELVGEMPVELELVRRRAVTNGNENRPAAATEHDARTN